MSKDKIISDIYYDRSGFASIKVTYEDAHKKDKSITLSDVQTWFNNNIKKTKQPPGMNSFIAPYPYYEYQVDLFFLEHLQNQKFKVGLVCIDIFSKYAVVIPIKSKSEGDIAAGIIEAIHKMGKKNQRR